MSIILFILHICLHIGNYQIEADSSPSGETGETEKEEKRKAAYKFRNSGGGTGASSRALVTARGRQNSQVNCAAAYVRVGDSREVVHAH